MLATSSSFFLVSFILLIAFAGGIYLTMLAAQDRKREMMRKFEAIVLDREADLARRYVQLVRTDAYGNVLPGKWPAECEYFINNVFLKAEPKLRSTVDGHRIAMHEVINDTVKAYRDQKHLFSDKEIEKMSPVDFEDYCAKVLSSLGWAASLTAISGDQGVDVIATKNGIRIGIQCKKYSSPVGNAAVQEIVAGIRFINAQYGIVVTNNTYTRAAHQLSAANQIFLLHYSDLHTVDEIIFGKAA